LPCVPTALLACALLLAAPPKDATLGRLVEQLGADSWHVREAAAEALLQHGAEAADALTRALDHRDAEVRHRARNLLAQLRWHPPPGLPAALAAALRDYADMPEDRRAAILGQVAHSAKSRAVPLLREALRNDRSLTVRKTALEHLARYDLAAAEAGLRTLTTVPRFKEWATAALGDLLVRADRVDDAIEAYELARRTDWTNTHVLAALASLYERRALWRQCIPVYRALATARPQEIQYWIRLGWCHYQLHERPQAERVWNDALERRGHTQGAYREVANAFLKTGARDKVLDVLRRGCDRHKESYELRRHLASALLAAGRTDDAIATYREAERLAPTQHQQQAISRELGRVLQRAGRLDEHVAREEAELKRMDGQIAPILEALVRRYARAGQMAKARATLARLRALYPQSDAARRAAEALQGAGAAP